MQGTLRSLGFVTLAALVAGCGGGSGDHQPGRDGPAGAEAGTAPARFRQGGTNG